MGLSVSCAVLLLTLGGCFSMGSENDERKFPRYHDREEWPGTAIAPMVMPAAQRLAYPGVESSGATPPDDPLFSFVISNMPIKEGLRQFARAYNLNLVADEDVTGILDVEFRDMPLDRALSFMLDSMDYYWEMNDGLIRVRSIESRHLTLDYLRLSRAGSGSSTAKVSSSASGSESGGGSEDEEAGSITISHEDAIHFWSELEAQLQSLLSGTGRLVINSLSGTVLVTDQHAHVKQVAQYIDQIN